MATVDKLENVCRLCLEKKNEMMPIFGNESMQRKVPHKLRGCLPVLVYQTDPLPKQICQFCAARLDDAYEFREHCLDVFKKMFNMLLKSQQTESVRIFLDAMTNSQDPCQAQLCKKSRAPPPLVPLPNSLPLDNSLAPINQINQDQLQNTCIESLPELPCEVEIKEMTTDTNLNDQITACESPVRRPKWLESYNTSLRTVTNTVPTFDTGDEQAFSKAEYQARKEEKRTSILEQALTGNITLNNLAKNSLTVDHRQRLQTKAKLTSEWWCVPCNTYFKSRDSLVKHMQVFCPRDFTCKRCYVSFESVELLAKHEADYHLVVRLGSVENLNDCDQCDRQFLSWNMLKQHRLCHHLAELTEFLDRNTRCSLCNRCFPTVRAYQNHMQLHRMNDSSLLPQRPFSAEPTFPMVRVERMGEVKRIDPFYENSKSLKCPTCGKVCTAQSALSNHMRTHKPKKYKCNFCGRLFGLLIRLAAHKMSHDKQAEVSPVMSAVEQEEALNAEREAREAAREARTRVNKRSYSEMMEKHDASPEDEPAEFKKIAKCGICSQWFGDHTTMLAHLQTHSDNYNCKNFTCHVCKKSFKEQWQLVRHEASHKRADKAAYTCNSCKKSFVDKSLYKAHQKTHMVDKTYHCAKCNKIFFKEVSLLAHQCTGGALSDKRPAAEPAQRTSTHDSNKRHKRDPASLPSRNSHMRMYNNDTYGNMTQQREIKVEADDESMPKLSPEILEYSVPIIEPRIEINEQSAPPPFKRTLIKTTNGYRCGVCKSPFVSRELAVAHLRSAHPIMPYQCPYCKKRFTTQYMFTHHIKTEHPEEPEK
ncbi:PR domain zinc finger protein 5 [Harpegnathos saltator]|uniref:Zinc finger protein Xfin n=1 Tax=Harpegnathos saltator TaxID=610380 RepID=E2BFY6_HARSA|nr:PR domain zinc finger protein 5 [Harpegnathos saltator]EFN85388.1 Zinc finger protein Xfin [Harpegnathos saltator]